MLVVAPTTAATFQLIRCGFTWSPFVWSIAVILSIWICESGIGAEVDELKNPLDILTIA